MFAGSEQSRTAADEQFPLQPCGAPAAGYYEEQCPGCSVGQRGQPDDRGESQPAAVSSSLGHRDGPGESGSSPLVSEAAFLKLPRCSRRLISCRPARPERWCTRTPGGAGFASC